MLVVKVLYIMYHQGVFHYIIFHYKALPPVSDGFIKRLRVWAMFQKALGFGMPAVGHLRVTWKVGRQGEENGCEHEQSRCFSGSHRSCWELLPIWCSRALRGISDRVGSYC